MKYMAWKIVFYIAISFALVACVDLNERGPFGGADGEHHKGQHQQGDENDDHDDGHHRGKHKQDKDDRHHDEDK